MVDRVPPSCSSGRARGGHKAGRSAGERHCSQHKHARKATMRREGCNKEPGWRSHQQGRRETEIYPYCLARSECLKSQVWWRCVGRGTSKCGTWKVIVCGRVAISEWRPQIYECNYARLLQFKFEVVNAHAREIFAQISQCTHTDTRHAPPPGAGLTRHTYTVLPRIQSLSVSLSHTARPRGVGRAVTLADLIMIKRDLSYSDYTKRYGLWH